ncbi:MAG: SHOCT domain-containing protein [Gaiellales bacterium]
MIGRRRRPLMRAAMVGGGAYMVGKNAQRHSQAEADQEARLNQLEAQQMQQPQAPAAPAAAPAGGDLVSKLTELKGLMDAGVLNADEFEAAKAKLLSQ